MIRIVKYTDMENISVKTKVIQKTSIDVSSDSGLYLCCIHKNTSGIVPAANNPSIEKNKIEYKMAIPQHVYHQIFDLVSNFM